MGESETPLLRNAFANISPVRIALFRNTVFKVVHFKPKLSMGNAHLILMDTFRPIKIPRRWVSAEINEANAIPNPRNASK